MTSPLIQSSLNLDETLRPVSNVAPLMCRTKLDSERLWSDFGATAGSDDVLASNFVREAGSNNFRREKICVLNSRKLCPNRKVVDFVVFAFK